MQKKTEKTNEWLSRKTLNWQSDRQTGNFIGPSVYGGSMSKGLNQKYITAESKVRWLLHFDHIACGRRKEFVIVITY